MKFSLKEHTLPAILLMIAAFAVFGPSLSHDFLLNWDDPGYVTKNEAIRAITWGNIKTAFTTFYVGNYAPLQIISYMLDYLVWGGRPAGFILGNILCHAASAVLFYLLLLRFSLSRLAAFAAALLFLVHPVQVESVVWISQRKNVLSMLFYLVSLTMYVQYREEPARNGRMRYILSLVAFVAALLVKSVAVILPLVLIVYDFCLPKERPTTKLLPNKIPYLLIALSIGCLAMLSQSAEYGGGGRTGYHGGGPVATLFTMLPVFLGYLRMIFWPAQLSVVYTPEIKTALDGEVIRAALFLLPFFGIAFLAFRRHRQLFFWLMTIPIGLLPVAQIVPLVTLMNDRYLYFPMLGIAACFGFLVDKILSSCSAGWRTPVTALLSGLLAVTAVVAVQRSQVWQNSQTLWQDATAKQPTSAVAWYMLGELHEKRGRFADAIAAEEQAKGLCKGVECRLVLRKLAELYLRENLLDKAGNSINELLRLFPDAADGYALSGHLSYQQGSLAKSENAYLQALRLDPLMVSAIMALGNVYLATGRPAIAMEKFKAASRLQKPTAELSYSMACAAALMGNRRLALDLLDEALRLGYNRPDLLLQNPELDSIKGEQEFTLLLQRHFPTR